MGCAVESLEKLKQVLGESRKDWCLVVLLDRETPSPAGRQMNRLVDDWDEDSGCAYDFYLPGYNDGEESGTEPWRSWKEGRIGRWAFDHRAFRRIYRDISREAADAWKYLGDCEILLFPTRRRWNGYAGNEVAPFARYNLDDVVKNGSTVGQFLLRMDRFLQGAGRSDWEEVKRGLDEIYSALIMPPQDATGEQAMRLSQGISELSKTHPKDGYVFISYSTKDWTTAHRIRGRIEKNGVPCWMAPRDIPAGTNYAYIIEQAIARCGIFLVLLSESSAQSVWVHKEILFAQGRLQQKNRFHAAWLSKPFDLEKTGSGMGFALDWKALLKVRPKLSVWRNGMERKAENLDKKGDERACGQTGQGGKQC